MQALASIIADLVRNRRAVTAVEYGLILALVVLALIVGLTQLGVTTSDLWGDVSTQVQDAR